MAKSIPLKHKDTGIHEMGLYGFSWDALFFGPLPALLRGDYLTFIALFVIYIALACIPALLSIVMLNLIWAFCDNRLYTRRLLRGGYALDGTDDENKEAMRKLGLEGVGDAILASKFRTCPFCVETIRVAALVCSCCQRELRASAENDPALPAENSLVH